MKYSLYGFYKYGLIIAAALHHYRFTAIVNENLYNLSSNVPTQLDKYLDRESQREVALFSESAMYYSYFRRTGG